MIAAASAAPVQRNAKEMPRTLLATILISNNFINIGIVILFAYLGEQLFYSVELQWVRFLLEVVVITFLILLFGEIIPKIYASRNRVKFATFMAVPLRVLDVIFSPVSLPMRSVTIGIQNRFGKQKTNLSVDQLSQALELTSEEDTTQEEQKILQGIVSFGNTDTKQVMKPRIDIFALNIQQKFSEIIPEIVENGYSRIPLGVHIRIDCTEGLRLGYEISDGVNSYNVKRNPS